MSDTHLQELRDHVAINKLKARFFRRLDTKDWDGFRDLFLDDARFELASGETIVGADTFVAYARDALGASQTVHHGHTPDITVDGPTEAHATWMLADYVEWPSGGEHGERRGFKGYGYHDETYRKVGGDWKIATWRLTYLRREPLDATPLPGRILGSDTPTREGAGDELP